MKHLFQFLLLLLSLISLEVFAQQDEEPCKLLLQNGIYKYFIATKTGNFSRDLKTYLSSQTFKNDFKEGKWGGSLSLEVDAIPISLGASASNSEISSFQQKITQSTTLNLTNTFYDNTSSSIPDVELAKVYVECIKNSRKEGFVVTAVVNETDVLFIISYRNRIQSDPMPKVIDFEIRNATGIRQSFQIGSTLLNETSITCDRNSEKDLILNLNTDRGIATFRVAAESNGINKSFPIGTIIASYLNWSEFQIASKNNDKNPIGPIWSSKYSNWAPADGRQVPNSGFLKVTNQPNLPDLRGVFLRAFNHFDREGEENQPPANQLDPDGDNRKRSIVQLDQFRKHKHSIKSSGINVGAPPPAYQIANDQTQSSTASFTTGDEGGDETRPKNMVVYYYIRIN